MAAADAGKNSAAADRSNDVSSPARNVPSSAPLAPVALAFALGATADRLTAPTLAAWLTLGTLAGLTWFGCWAAGRAKFSALALLILWGTFGGARHHQTWFIQRVDDVSTCATRTPAPAMLEVVALESVRSFSPRPKGRLKLKGDDSFSQVDVAAVRIRDRSAWRPISGGVRIGIIGLPPEVRAGDRLRVVGKLALPEPAMNPGSFDYAARLRADGVSAVLTTEGAESFTLLSDARDYGAAEALDELRLSAKRTLAAHLAPDVAGMGQALVLGGYESAGRPQIDRFMRTGSIHILAISGAHVAVLAWILFFSVTRGLAPRRLGLLGIGLLTLAYCTLVGSETPVVRATVLVLITCGTSWLWRRRASWNALFIAALVALIWRPADLFAMGPQLSFLAAGVLTAIDIRFASQAPEDPLDRLLLEAQPWWKKGARRLGRWLAKTVAVSALVYGATLPLVLWNYHVISPAAIVLNLLLAIPATLALASGFGVLSLAWIAPPLATACAWLCTGSLRAMDAMVSAVHEWPAAYWWSPSPGLWWVLGFYLGLVVYLEFGRANWLRTWRWPVVLAWGALGAFSVSEPWPQERLTCTFLDVGHGLAVIVELPDGRALLYDAGQLGSPDKAARAVSGALWSQGRGSVQAMIVSHADSDHFNAVPQLVEQFQFDVVYLAPSFHRNTGGAAQMFFEALAGARVPSRPLVAGDGFTDEAGAVVRVLQPDAEGVPGEDNANSLVVAIEYAGRRILLTGDLEEAGLDRLLQSPRLPCDVLLAPHHGSANSLPDALAEWASPTYVVASGDPAKTSGSVAERYRANGSHVLTTGEVGAVRATITAAGIKLETFGPREVGSPEEEPETNEGRADD